MKKVLKDGSAREKFINMATAQGADRALAEKMFTTNGDNILPHSNQITTLKAESTGRLTKSTFLATQVPNHLSGSRKFGKIQKSSYLNFCIGVVQYSRVQVFYTCTGILRRILNILIKIRQSLFYKNINLYQLKTVSLFTFQFILYFIFLRSIFSLYPEI